MGEREEDDRDGRKDGKRYRSGRERNRDWRKRKRDGDGRERERETER